MKRVILESPYRGKYGSLDEIDSNVAFARKCIRDILLRNEAPIASHLLFPQLLDDSVPEERAMGIAAGHAWLGAADYVTFYTDRGWSSGMLDTLNLCLHSETTDHPVYFYIRALDSKELIVPLRYPKHDFTKNFKYLETRIQR